MAKTQIIVGDRVIFHTGFMGGEQGSPHPTWWPEDKYGVVVQLGQGRVLLEFRDKSREWAGLKDVELVKERITK